MAHTFHDLKLKTVAELREVAEEIGLQGYTQMNKEHLLPVVCEKLGIDMVEHHQVVGIDKPALKAKIRDLKKQRDAAVGAQDYATLKTVRRQLHRINRDIRRHLS